MSSYKSRRSGDQWGGGRLVTQFTAVTVEAASILVGAADLDK